jgi:hypothetical protein
MAGSLWRQDVNSTIAEQLTAGPGYDYQPDWSADGRWITFSRYNHDAMELWLLDLHDGRTRQLTSGSAVNLEPRFSPDGKRLAFVSTSYKGHFHIFAGRFEDGELRDVQQLTPENVSSLPRYYYSQVDHEISPVWSHDGSEIVFISNREHIHGTGGFWRMKAARRYAHESTTRKRLGKPARTFRRRQAHGIRVVSRTVMASALGDAEAGGDAFPIVWRLRQYQSAMVPDGSKIAFISNRSAIRRCGSKRFPAGRRTRLLPERKYEADGEVTSASYRPRRKPVAARVFVTAEDGRAYAPDDGWMEADDSFDRKERPFEAHYFVTKGISEVAVPAGNVQVGVMRGFEYRFEELSLDVLAGKTLEATVPLRQIEWKSPDTRWVSGDAHVHMNYAGTYRNTPSHLIEQAAAENLSIVENLVVNKEQRFPDIAYFSPKLDPASDEDRLLQHAQEFHTSYWGHLGLLNLTQNLILPGYAAYPNTEAASLFPANANVADLAHEQGALVGYVHPLESVPNPAKDAVTFELPADVALGKVDYIEVVGFSDHKSTAEVWYKLLNCGFRLPTAAGTDFMGNYASLRGPIGLNRVYADVPAGSLRLEPWLQSIKAGRTFATNGPLLRFELGGEAPGGDVHLDKKQGVFFKAALGSIVPVDYLQIVCNGKVARELDLSANRTSAYVEGKLPLESSGWCILRTFSDKAEYPILDLYPYATTSPVYVDIAGAPLRNTEDAAYFVAWMGRLITAAQNSTAWNTETEQQAVLAIFKKARQKYENIAKPGP